MSDTRKIEEQTKEELLKDCELSLEDLEKVSGGDSKTIDIQIGNTKGTKEVVKKFVEVHM